MRPLTRSATVLLYMIMMVTAPAASHAGQCGTPEGVWLHSNARIRVQIAPCGAALCGKIIWLKNPTDAAGAPRSDIENPDRTQRTRPVVGMTVIQGLVRSSPCVWTNGTIYNPDDGETYSARVTMVDPNTLHLRAYVSFPLFGKTQIWTRFRE